MILRVVSGLAGGHEPPHAAGLVRSHLGRDDATGELIEVTVWDDAEAARASPPPPGGDAAHFDVGATWLEWSRDEPSCFRLAVGRFTKPGADLEMQATLRERVPLLGGDVTETAVGRRIVDRTVEVVFFSAWARMPAAWALDRPFWADISLHYDGFVIRVCRPTRPVVSRSARA